jgi:toxin ParE1/3/4
VPGRHIRDPGEACRAPPPPLNRLPLLALGIREYRQTFFKPCRVIYRDRRARVRVPDRRRRRDMQALLQRRLLRA